MKKVVPLHSHLKDGLQGVLIKIVAENNFQNFCKKIWRIKNNAYLCSPVQKTGSRKRDLEVH